jgi:orotate phosphoribosyltransferase
MRDALKHIIQRNSLKQGHFVLASGQSSTYYIDCRKTTLDGEGLRLICELLLPKIEALHVDAVGGMTLGADPIVSGLIQLSAQWGRPLQGFLVRKAAKAHGTGQQIEGNLQAGMRVALIEDVITTGTSTRQAFEAVKANFPDVNVVGSFAVVDREAGGAEAFKAMGLSLEAIFAVSELLTPASV